MTIQIRAGDIPDTVVVTGYLTEFGQYDRHNGRDGGWRETIERDAAMRAVAARPRMRLLIDGRGIAVARSSDGTLDLTVDARGLKMTAILVEKDPDVSRLRGDESIDFEFNVTEEEWSDADTRRTIKGFDLNGCAISIET